MTDKQQNPTTPLPQLLVSEAIRELQKKYENALDKTTHIEMEICQMGIKPGFAIASQLCRDSADINTFDDIVKFLVSRFSPALFNLTPQSKIDKANVLKISYADKLPSWFNCVLSSPGLPMTPGQIFWFRSYAYFILGLYSGALLHFGYKATVALENASLPSLRMLFRFEHLDGAWDYVANHKI